MNFFVRIVCLLQVTSQLFILVGCKQTRPYTQTPPPPPPPPPPPAVDTTSKKPTLPVIAHGMIAPLALSQSADGSKRLFIADETGTVWIIGADGKKLATPFIDISSRMITLSSSYDERGLLGMCFHPDFKNNGKFYLFYTAPPRPGFPI